MLLSVHVALCREAQALLKKNGKIIVRPRYVMETYVHHVVVYAKGWAQKMKLETSVAFVKHITWLQNAYVRCAELVHEDTDRNPHF